MKSRRCYNFIVIGHYITVIGMPTLMMSKNTMISFYSETKYNYDKRYIDLVVIWAASGKGMNKCFLKTSS